MGIFALNALLSRYFYWLTSLGLSWTTSLTETLRGTSGRFSFLNISYRVLNASLCTFPILTSGLVGSGFYSA